MREREREELKKGCVPVIQYYIILKAESRVRLLQKLYEGMKDVLSIRMIPLHYIFPPFSWIYKDILKRRETRWRAIFKQRKTNWHSLQLLTICYPNMFEIF
jgi:hypothetical protein